MIVYMVTIFDAHQMSTQRVFSTQEKADAAVFQHAVDRFGYDEAVEAKDAGVLDSLFDYTIEDFAVDG